MVLGLWGVLGRGVLGLHGRRDARISQKVDSRRAAGHRKSMENMAQNRWTICSSIGSQNCVFAGHGIGPKFDEKSMENLFGKCDWQHGDFIDPSGAKLQFSDVGSMENFIKMVSAINV